MLHTPAYPSVFDKSCRFTDQQSTAAICMGVRSLPMCTYIPLYGDYHDNLNEIQLRSPKNEERLEQGLLGLGSRSLSIPSRLLWPEGLCISPTTSKAHIIWKMENCSTTDGVVLLRCKHRLWELTTMGQYRALVRLCMLNVYENCWFIQIHKIKRERRRESPWIWIWISIDRGLGLAQLLGEFGGESHALGISRVQKHRRSYWGGDSVQDDDFKVFDLLFRCL